MSTPRIDCPKGVYYAQLSFLGKNVEAQSTISPAIWRDSFLLGYGQETKILKLKTESQGVGHRQHNWNGVIPKKRY